jgi:hypothetical protein
MKRIYAFILGVTECRNDITTHYPEPFIYWYDKGRTIGINLLENK